MVCMLMIHGKGPHLFNLLRQNIIVASQCGNLEARLAIWLFAASELHCYSCFSAT